MRIVRTLFWFFVVSALIVTALLFFSQNLGEVTVEFAYWSSPPLPLALTLLASFSVGVTLAGLHFLFDVLRMRNEVRKARRLSELLERELDALRNAPLYDELPSAPSSPITPFEAHLTHEGQPEASVDSWGPKRFR
jgi:uncharacterized integral membrane protein